MRMRKSILLCAGLCVVLFSGCGVAVSNQTELAASDAIIGETHRAEGTEKATEKELEYESAGEVSFDTEKASLVWPGPDKCMYVKYGNEKIELPGWVCNGCAANCSISLRDLTGDGNDEIVFCTNNGNEDFMDNSSNVCFVFDLVEKKDLSPVTGKYVISNDVDGQKILCDFYLKPSYAEKVMNDVESDCNKRNTCNPLTLESDGSLNLSNAGKQKHVNSDISDDGSLYMDICINITHRVIFSMKDNVCEISSINSEPGISGDCSTQCLPVSRFIRDALLGNVDIKAVYDDNGKMVDINVRDLREYFDDLGNYYSIMVVDLDKDDIAEVMLETYDFVYVFHEEDEIVFVNIDSVKSIGSVCDDGNVVTSYINEDGKSEDALYRLTFEHGRMSKTRIDNKDIDGSYKWCYEIPYSTNNIRMLKEYN